MRFLTSAWGRRVRPAPRERKPQRNRSGRFLLLTAGSGLVAALLALGIEGATVVVGQLTLPHSGQLDATTLFPTPGPQHKTVDVYDPPPATSHEPGEDGAPQSGNPAPESPEPGESPDN